MNGRVARALRRAIYKDKTYRMRSYTKDRRGVVRAGLERYQYQQIKKMHNRGQLNSAA